MQNTSCRAFSCSPFSSAAATLPGVKYIPTALNSAPWAGSSGLTIGIGFALFAFLTFEICRIYKVYDYKNYIRQVIGPLWPVMDILTVLIAIVLIAVMAAATGSILNRSACRIS